MFSLAQIQNGKGEHRLLWNSERRFRIVLFLVPPLCSVAAHAHAVPRLDSALQFWLGVLGFIRWSLALIAVTAAISYYPHILALDLDVTAADTAHDSGQKVVRLFYLAPFPFLVALVGSLSETSLAPTTYQGRSKARFGFTREVALALVVALTLLDCLPFAAVSSAFLYAVGGGLASLPLELVVSGAVAITSNFGLLSLFCEESCYGSLYLVLKHDDEIGAMVMVCVAVMALATAAPLLHGLL